MLSSAHRLSLVEDLDFGDVIQTEKGLLEVEAVMRTRGETKVHGVPIGKKAKRAVVAFPPESVVTIPAPPDVLSLIEADFVAMATNGNRTLAYRQDQNNLIATVEGCAWTLRMRNG
jgi:hypothetical protein